jgi:hypothetical protein
MHRAAYSAFRVEPLEGRRVMTAAGFPFVETFEAGSLAGLGDYWTFDASSGTIAVDTADGPHGGSYQLRLDRNGGTNTSTRSATLQLDLSQAGGTANLDFWAQRLVHAESNYLAVYVSGDGVTWFNAQLNSDPLGTGLPFDVAGGQQHFSVDLDNLLSTVGIALDADVYVRFTQTTALNYPDSAITLDDVRLSTADVFGPRVTDLASSGAAAHSLDQITVTFNEPIDPATFTETMVGLTGPDGQPIALLGGPVDTGDGRTFTLQLDTPQVLQGAYNLTIAATVADLAGNPINQDADFRLGDGFSGSVVLGATAHDVPFNEGFEAGLLGALDPSWSFDVDGGTIVVTNAGNPHSGGYHLLMTRPDAVDPTTRGAIVKLNLASAPANLTLDFWLQFLNQTTDSEFHLDVSGDGLSWHTVQTVRGSDSGTVAGEYRRLAFDLRSLLTGQGVALDADVYVRFLHQSANANLGAAVSIDDVRIGDYDVSGPRVVSQTPNGSFAGPMTSLTFAFNEAINTTTLSAAHVRVLDPAGNVVSLLGNPVNAGDDKTFTLTFATAQKLAGTYRLIIDPTVTDAAGNQMNQNADYLLGDGYSGTIALPNVAVSLPFVESFESGSLGGLNAGWLFAAPLGTIDVVGNSAGSPYAGSYQLRMMRDGGTTTSARTATLQLNVAGLTNPVTIDFWARSVFAAAGDTFSIDVYSADGAIATNLATNVAPGQGYTHYAYNLSGILQTGHGDFFVRITHNTTSSQPFSAILFDNVRVRQAALNHAPTLTTVGPFPGGTEDVGYTITYAALLAATDAADVDGDTTIRFRIDGVTNGTLKLNGSVVTAGTTLVGPGDTLFWMPAADTSGAATGAFTIRAWDGDLASGTALLVAVDVAAVPDAPVLDASKSPALTAIREDAPAPSGPVGTLVSALVSFAGSPGNVTDADLGAELGIAVTAVDAAHGTWYFSLNDGATWTPLGTVSNSAALLLFADAGTRLYFQPAADFNGTLAAALTFRAWDRTTGTNGGTADTTTNGDSTAFSAATDTAVLVVIAVNDAPTLTGTNDFSQINEDELDNEGETVGSLIAGHAADAELGDTIGIAIIDLDGGNGTWQYSIDGGTTWSDVGTVDDANALLLRTVDKLRFVPNGQNGTAASLTFLAWDGTVGTEGTTVDTVVRGGDTAFSDTTALANLLVASLNDTPLLFGSVDFTGLDENQTDNDGQLVSTLIDGWTIDVDADAAAGIAVVGTIDGNGRWQFSLDDGTTWNDLGAVGTDSALLLRPSDRVRFVPDGENGTSASITFRAWDLSAGSAGTKVDLASAGALSPFSVGSSTTAVAVTSANDAPVLSGTRDFTTLTEDQTNDAGTTVAALTAGFIADVDLSAARGVAIIDLTSGNGKWQYSLDNGTTWRDVGTVRDSAALLLRSTDRLRFVPDGKNDTAASLTFVAWDQSSGSAGSRVDASAGGGGAAFSIAAATANIAVTALNDAPTLTGASGFTTITEQQTSNGGNDVSTLLAGWVNDVDPNAAAGIAIVGLVGGNGTWQYSLDDGATWLAVGSVSGTSALLLRSTDKLRFVPDGMNGIAASLTLRAWDQTAGSAGTKVNASTNGGTTAFSATTAVAGLTVTAQNDAPVLDATKSPMLLPVLEDAAAPVGKVGTLVTQFVFGIGSLKNVADVDVGAQLGIAVTGASTSGTWYYSLDDGTNWSPLGSVSVGAARLLAADGMTRLYFKPNANINGTLAGVLAFQAWDRTTGINGGVANAAVNGGTSAFSATSDTATIVVTAVNDAPTLDATKSPALLPVLEDASTPAGPVGTLITNLARVSGSLKNVADNDVGALAGIAVTAADITQGTWYYSTNNGTAWSPLGTVAATSARLLAADAGTRIYFKPKLDYNGTLTAALTFRAWDQTTGVNGALANPGAGGGSTAYSTATDTASLVVTAVNDAPVLDTSKSPTLAPVTRNAGNPIGKVGTLIDALVHLSGSLKNVNDVDVGAKTGIAVTAASTSGTWFYSTNNGSTWAALGAVGTASAKLLAADGLTRLYFKPNLGFRGTIASAITFRAWDRTAGANGANANVGAGGLTTPYSKFADTAAIVVRD